MIMRKINLLAVLLAAVCAPYAQADSITDGTFNFTVTSGSPAPTGSFVWDNTTSTWDSFIVDWDGAVFNYGKVFAGTNFTLSRLPASSEWCAAGPANLTSSCAGPANFCLGILPDSIGGCAGIIPEHPTFTDGFAGANGKYTVTETTVTTPEPSSFALILLGLGALLVTRKRWGHGLRLAA